MGSFRPLFSVSVEHAYFSDGLWKGLEFVPVPATRKVIDGANILVRQTRGGMSAFYDEDRTDALRLYALDAHGPLCFSFKVYVKDRAFANYTSPAMRNGNGILSFDNRGGTARVEGGRVLLCRDGSASDKDFKAIDLLVAEGVLCDRDRRAPPDFLVHVCVEPQNDEGTAWPFPECLVRFDARRAFWKYHLLGGMNRSNTFIVDLDSRVEFEFCGEVMLPGDRAAKVFRSREPIPVLEKSGCRFQLREQGAGTGKVLVKRLPVASEGRFGMELINGRNEIVAESYINC